MHPIAMLKSLKHTAITIPIKARNRSEVMRTGHISANLHCCIMATSPK